MELENTLEDGELSNDSDCYTPLERPASYSALVLPVLQKKIESESDGVVSISSDFDSDSDSASFRAKKPKIKNKKKLPQRLGSKTRKYDIWSNRAQEDSLLENLTTCDVSHKDRSRNVETYDYSIGRKYYKELNKDIASNTRMNNKRSRADIRDASLRLTNRQRVSGEDSIKGSARELLDIHSGSDKNDTDLAVEIANKLYEEKEDLIVKIVSTVGKEKALKIYNDVKRIEADGGMLIMNQSRRRTPGGVYLFLLKHDDELTQEQRCIIFEDEKKNYKEFIKQKKKKRVEQMKARIGPSKPKNLPELLTKVELVQKLNGKIWSPKNNQENDDVVNPPPTPETDGHVDSGDAEIMEMTEQPLEYNSSGSGGKNVDKYESDFLDLSAGNDMDMF